MPTRAPSNYLSNGSAGEAAAAMTPDEIRMLRLARIDAVYRQLPLTLAVTLFNAVLTATVLAPVLHTTWLVAWTVAITLTVVLRLFAWERFRHVLPEVRTREAWGRFSVIGAASSGILWGVLSTAFMPSEEPYPVFVAFVIGGMCAGAATVNSAHLPSVVAFVFPSVLPLAAWFALRGTRLDAVMAAMTGLFSLAMVLAAARFGRFFDHSVRVRIDLARHTQALAEANQRLRDAMDQHQATEAALRHSQKMEAIGSLTAGVAHDLNNLLMAISGSAELLERRLGAAPQHARQLGAIFRATERGARLTRHLLAFARKEVLAPQSVDLNALLHGITTLLEATLGKSIRIELQLGEALWPVWVDRSEIERAIINLAINARDAMPEGGTLTLATANGNLPPPHSGDDPPPGACVVVSISDTGEGMSAEVRDRAFDPFFTTKPVGQGSGLGLSQVYGLMKQSGGATQIESASGAGTTVRLFLPRAAPDPVEVGIPMEVGDPVAVAAVSPSAPAPAPAAVLRAGAALHVVVLDDEEAVADVVSEMLRGAGYRVSGFVEVAAALHCLESDATVAALVTDLGMPDRPGDEVARVARAARPGLPVLFITGYNDATPLTGEPWQLRKPFTAAELATMLARALAADAARIGC
jgi:signal transduction histidine kinase/CheY-like chemotaxis protein